MTAVESYNDASESGSDVLLYYLSRLLPLDAVDVDALLLSETNALIVGGPHSFAIQPSSGCTVKHYATGLPEDVISVARRNGVTQVAPTVHSAHTMGLSLIAAGIDAHYPSPDAVYDVECKPRFYNILAAAGLPVPRTEVCSTQEEIELAARKLGKCVLKTAEGSSSEGLKPLDGRRELTDRDREAICDHIRLRDAKALGRSVVQQFVGNNEWGLQTMFEASDKGINIRWAASTRKMIVGLHGRLEGHIFDPDDRERVEITQDLLLPLAQKVLEAIFVGKPEMYSSGPNQYTMNWDWRSDTDAWLLDASLRWAPNLQQVGNASIGLEAWLDTFPALARDWAQGKPVDLELLRTASFGPQRAVIMRKPFTATGGTIVSVAEERASLTDNAFFSFIPRTGAVLPASHEPDVATAFADWPLICVDAPTIHEAWQLWQRALRDTGIAALRGGVIYGAESEQLGYAGY